MNKKILLTGIMLTLGAISAYAGKNPGDVNFRTDKSLESHPVRYQLVFSDGLTVGYTGCLSPSPNYSPSGVLPVSVIGNRAGSVKIMVQDCAIAAAPIALPSFEYSSRSSYYLACSFDGKGGFCRQEKP